MNVLRKLTIFSALFILPLCSCTEQEPVKVGFIGSLSGKASELCLIARDGVQLAVEEINAQGGLNGQQVELVVFDIKNKADNAFEGIDVLTDSGVKAIIGPATSEMAKAATPAANKRKTVLISPTASTVELSGLDDYFFRVYPTSAANASSLADYAATVAKNQRVAILSNLANQAFVEPWQSAFTKRFKELGGEITTTLSFNPENGKISLFEFAKEIIATEPDGVLILTNSIDAGLFSQQVKKLTDDIDLYGSDWTFSGELVQYGGKNVEGFTFTTNIDMDNETAEFKSFKSNFVDRFDKEPNFPAVFSYEATQLLFDALRKNSNRQQLPDTLKKLARVKGLQAEYKLDAYGDIERPPYLNKVKDGEFVRVTTP
jgi:branched-chain amino acid transport system substrate-binding protein